MQNTSLLQLCCAVGCSAWPKTATQGLGLVWGDTVKMKVLESLLSLCSDKAHAGEEKEKALFRKLLFL